MGAATFAKVTRTDFFPSDETWEETLAQLNEQIPTMENYQGKLGESADILAECLQMDDSLSSLAHRLYVYASLSLDEDNRVGKYQEMRDRANTLYSKLGQATAFIGPEILKIPDEKLRTFLDENSDLAVYRFYLEDLLRRKAHILSEKEENIMALAGSVTRGPSNIFTMIDDADIKFPNVLDENGDEIELTRGRYGKLLESPDRSVRRAASKAYNETYLDYVNTLGATLAASVKDDQFYTQARGYNTTLERVLDADSIPTDVFYNLLQAASENLAPLHKYIALRKQALGYDTLFGFDMYVPLVEEVKTNYDYEEAKAIVLRALAPLGDDYLASLKMGLNSRWVDVYETAGKGSGA